MFDTVSRASRALGPLTAYMMGLDTFEDVAETFKAVMGKPVTYHRLKSAWMEEHGAASEVSFARRIGRLNAMAPLNAALLIDDDTAADDEKTRFHAVRALRHLSRNKA